MTFNLYFHSKPSFSEESAKNRVVQATIHVDDVKLHEHLVPRVAAVQPDGIERYRLLAPLIVGGFEDLRPILIHNGKDAAQIVREGKISFHHAVLPDDDGVAVKVIELARDTIICHFLIHQVHVILQNHLKLLIMKDCNSSYIRTEKPIAGLLFLGLTILY